MIAYWFLFAIFALGTMRTELTAPAWRTSLAGGPPGAGPSIPPGSSRRSEVLLTVAALVTAAMIGLRFKVGADWDTYNVIYGMIAQRGFTWAAQRWEPGYALVNIAAHDLGAGMWFVNLVCAAIFMYGVVKFARSQPNPWLAVLVAVPYLIIGVGMGYTRQAVAIGCCMAGLSALSRGSLIKFAVWVLAGAMFHRTAVIVFPFVVLPYTRNSLQMTLVAVIGGYIGYKLLSAGIDKYERLYIHHVYESQGSGVRLAMNLPPAVLFLLMSRRFGLSDEQRAVWRNFSIAAVLSFFVWLGTNNTVAVDRLALYLIPLQLVVLSRLPNVLSNSEAPSGEMKSLVILYCALVQFTWLNFANHARYWVPYNLYPVH